MKSHGSDNEPSRHEAVRHMSRSGPDMARRLILEPRKPYVFPDILDWPERRVEETMVRTCRLIARRGYKNG